MMPRYSYRHCEKRSDVAGRLDCHVAALLAMTSLVRYARSFGNVL
jgi:hypothetical protein